MRQFNEIEWSKIAQYHVIVVTTPRGERIVHSSKNRQYLLRLITERYAGEVKYAF